MSRHRPCRAAPPHNRRGVVVIGLSLSVFMAVLTGCATQSPPLAPVDGVLLIVVDALRPDHLGAYGYGRPTSPALDRLAAEGTVFEAAFSPSGWTRPAIASMFTGLYPSEHGLRERARRKNQEFFISRLDDRVSTLAENLQANGINTVAIVANPHLGREQGFAQGFDEYSQEEWTAAQIFEKFQDWLDRNRPPRFFAYLHFMDVHWPYSPPPPYDTQFGEPVGGFDFSELDWDLFRRQLRTGETVLGAAELDSLKTLYDGQIRYLDDELDRFLVGRGEEASSWLILVTADHGEEFQEHGGMGHGPFLYDIHTRVPLILRLPEGRRPHRRVSRPVSLVDMMPTVLESAGIVAPGGVRNPSLLPLVFGDNPAEEPVVFGEERYENLYSRNSVRTARYKFIRTEIQARGEASAGSVQLELFDLARDPLEQRNLAANRPAVVSEMAARLDEHILRMEAVTAGPPSEVPLEDETVERLRSLGYLE